MDDCCAPRTPEGYDDVFDARFARRLARRYERRGPTRPARRIIEFAESVGLTGATVLEVGGGIGDIQLELLRRGAARTVNLELSGQYESEAGRLIDGAGVSGRVTRMQGVDVAVDPAAVGAADIVVLNRVVCCYPDYDRLLTGAASLARRAVVFSHPPRTVLARAFARVGNAEMSMTGRAFRGYLHPPAAMIAALERNGLATTFRRRAGLWTVVGAQRG
ncbi:methyltransferase domain-containing protein [Microbacterium aureliae]